ncbi:MAG: NAD(P)/FAD-dependent oxidoreductase [Deltaproteobacteria bacterium]|nr:MAG: NAD(P)/FAD-dependent oxidoreductase [Deltaproteobacteria bacterium]
MSTSAYDPNAMSKARSRTPLPESVDVAIVGCGLGGLLAGAMLARAGHRVACFDGHYVAGGCATQFRRRASEGFFNFDVGLHYVGDCDGDGAIPASLREVGVEVDFEPMDPDGFDVLSFPGVEFRVPVGHDAYEARLRSTFPGEGRAIGKYMRLLREVDHMIGFMARRGERQDLRTGLEVLLRGRSMARAMRRTMKEVLDDITDNALLRAVLLGQHGDYGLPPSQVSALLHTGLVNHYLRGAWYPRGGGQVIADRIAEVIEARGGTIHLRRPVERILVEHGRAVGVRTAPTSKNDAQEVRAKVVLSNADLKRTWLELVGPEHLDAAQRSTAEGWQMGGALFMTCLGVRGDLRDLGMGQANWWVFDSPDVEGVYRDEAGASGRPAVRGVYITSASLKDPGNPLHHAPEGHQSLEIMTLVPWDPARWGAPDASDEAVMGWDYKRDESYRSVKAAVEADVLTHAERVFPGLGERIVYRESATPLTHTRFTRASAGTGYGLASTPAQFMEHRPGYRGPVDGLYQCGASTRAGHGIVGSLRSGRAAGRRILRALDAD